MLKNRNYYFTQIFLILFVSLLYIEAFFKILSFGNLFQIEFIRIALFTATICLIIAFVCSFFKPRVSIVIIFISIFLSATYSLIQLNFHSFMGNYMSFNAAGDGLGRVGEQVKDFVMYIKPIYYLFYLPFVILIILFIAIKNILIKDKISFKSTVSKLLLIVIVHILSLSTLYLNTFQDTNQIKSNKILYKAPFLLELSLKQFGTMRFLHRDLVYMFSSKQIENIIIEDIPVVNQPVIVPNYERIIDDSEWRSLIDNENNEQIKKLHNFFINQSVTPRNDMTGIFKDKNLILIMVEAFDMIAINEKLTPTLYKLSTEGLNFDNYYTPKYSCTTGESEFIALTSIIPSSTVCTPNEYKHNNYKTSIFELFNKSGYYSTSYHNYSDKFYARKILHKNMGSVKFYNNEDLNIKRIWGWPSDLNLMEEAVPHFIEKDKFFSFVITSTTHFPYNEDGHVGVVLDHWDKVKDLPYNIKIKRYMAKAIELDLALEYLLDTLEQRKILDDTVIVLFGDHHPLNMEFKYLNEASSIDRFQDFNIDRLPFIIYNSTIEPKKVNKTASTFDILPTVANLFDLDYDPRYYIGKDVFSDEETIVVFTTGSWITDKAIYFSRSNEVKKLQDDIDDDYISSINSKVNNYFNVSNETLKRDYFKYRFSK